jgi:hypothetical protein
MSIEVMKQALDALEEHGTHYARHEDDYIKTITALRQAIEFEEIVKKGTKAWADTPDGWEPPKKEWVGFTHEELAWLNEALNLGGRFAVIEAIEAKLKEKNT